METEKTAKTAKTAKTLLILAGFILLSCQAERSIVGLCSESMCAAGAVVGDGLTVVSSLPYDHQFVEETGQELRKLDGNGWIYGADSDVGDPLDICKKQLEIGDLLTGYVYFSSGEYYKFDLEVAGFMRNEFYSAHKAPDGFEYGPLLSDKGCVVGVAIGRTAFTYQVFIKPLQPVRGDNNN